MEDRFNLERFIAAQKDKIDSVRGELRHACKYGHWMWFVFPQLRGLGKSWMANHNAISSRAEAEAYLKHPTLGRDSSSVRNSSMLSRAVLSRRFSVG
jgi:uncharacterized protein (DUF1810 family)